MNGEITSITGVEQLNISYITRLMGSIVASTKSCGTGTCCVYGNTNLVTTRIVISRDDVNPLCLIAQHGIVR